MPGSKVYINKFEKETAIISSKTPTILARALMDIVFTKDALATCSLKGQKSNGRGGSENEKRPGLNQAGVDAIVG